MGDAVVGLDESGDEGGVVVEDADDFAGEPDDFVHGFCLVVGGDEGVEGWDGGLGFVIGVCFDGAVFLVGVGAVEVFPEAGVHFDGDVFGAEAEVVFFLVHFFPCGGHLDDFEVEAEAGFEGFVFEDDEEIGVGFVAGGEGEGETLPLVVSEDAVGAAFGEAGACEGGFGFGDGEWSGFGVGEGDHGVAVGAGLHAFAVAFEHF